MRLVTTPERRTPMRAVVFGPSGRYELTILDLTDLCRKAIRDGLVIVEDEPVDWSRPEDAG